MSRLLIDASEFFANPIRSGIQRVVRELLTAWPAETPMQLVVLDRTSRAFTAVPDAAAALALGSAQNPYVDDAKLARTLAALIHDGSSPPIRPKAGDRVLAPELFVHPLRDEFYRTLLEEGVELYMIAYDFLAWLQPASVNIPKTGGLNRYLTTLRLATSRSFISSAVRDEYFGRIARDPIDPCDPVITLGADGLKRLTRRPDAQDMILCVGALDGRKGQDRVFEAFQKVDAGAGPRLVFAGRVPREARGNLQPLLSYTGDRVEIIDDPDDARLAQLVADARACVFVSRFEGFGLPAVESLHQGTPIMVYEKLPAVSDIAPLGQIRLPSADVDDIADGLRRLMDDAEASRLRAETESLRLRTWREFARDTAAWASV